MAAVLPSVPEILPVNIEVTVPADKVGITLMQPYLNGHAITASLPYHWQGLAAAQQLDRVRRTMDVSAEAGSTFIVFPEYSLPGLDGAMLVERRVVDGPWRENSVVIGGVSGLDADEYGQLCDVLKPEDSQLNDPSALKRGEWVNACVVWAKDRNGNVRHWVQPKLRPSGLELPAPVNTMFNGRCIYLFQCHDATDLPFRFFCLLCSDWFRQIDGTAVLDTLRRSLQSTWSNEDRDSGRARDPRDIHLAFVPQCNEDSNARNQLEATRRFFGPLRGCGLVRTANCAVVFANTAGRGTPGPASKFGKSGVVFHPGVQLDFKECRETYAVTTAERRNQSDALGRCREGLLREDGACIHSFGVVQPSRVGVENVDRTPPLLDACVYPLGDGLPPDSRVPGGGVYAVVKWTLDGIESARPFAPNHKKHPLRADFDDAHKHVKEGIHSKNPLSLVNCPYVMSPQDDDQPERADEWDHRQKQTLETTMQAIGLLHVHVGARIQDSPLHANITLGGRDLHVLVVSGPTHPDCREYAISRNTPRVRKTLLLTHDADSSRLDQLDRRNIMDGVDAEPPEDPEYANSELSFVWRGFRNLADAAKDSVTPDELRSAFRKELPHRA